MFQNESVLRCQIKLLDVFLFLMSGDLMIICLFRLILWPTMSPP
jgi:hypothetical protein